MDAIEGHFKQQTQKKTFFARLFQCHLLLAQNGLPMAYVARLFSKMELVYYYFTRWKNAGVIEQIHELLRDKVRKKAGRESSPSMVLMDSQSVKTTRLGCESRGVDGGKKIKGRKRNRITDTMSLLLALVVHAANVHDSKGATDVIALLKGRFERLIKIVTDGVYHGELIEKTKTALG